MNCQESEQLMQEFVDDRLCGEQLESFLYHINRCTGCYKEMEVSYLIKEALARLEDGTAFDLHSELKEKVVMMENCVKLQNRLSVIRRLVLTVAGVVLAVDFVAVYLFLL